ncbi:MAG: DUF4175 family protein [Paracoccus sp. (in: a-proteobacteria)]|nr:DUF4175 family protein [Paracoccus sp. (in: a-proteobacteria)]
MNGKARPAGRSKARAVAAPDAPGRDERRLARTLRLTRAGLWWEAIARAFWPAGTLALAGLAALLWGLPGALPPPALQWALAIYALCLTGALGAGIFALRRPKRGAELVRVDLALPGRPLSALRDHPVLGAENDPLWQAHRAQMEEAARAARPAPPRADLAPRDPLALRLAALTALVMALLFGSAGQIGPGLSAIAATWRPDLPAAPRAAGLGWEGWITPPRHTGRPTLYLNDQPDGAVLDLPQGSAVSFRLYGDGAGPDADIGPRVNEDDRAPEFRVERSGVISIAGSSFTVTMRPDAPPQIAAGPAAERRVDGRLVQRFSASDDFGVAAGRAVLTLDLPRVPRRFGLSAAPDPLPAVELDLPLPRGSRAQIEGQLTADLKKHPWANLPVVLQLRAEDGIGQIAEAEPLRLDLPGRRFFDPVAASIIEMRRDLLWSRENIPRMAQLLRALVWEPEGFLDAEIASGLHGIALRLEQGDLPDEARQQIAETLWLVAVQLEDGGLDDAIARMRRAQERLSQAIRQGASPEEIQRLMDELREATEAYKRALPVNEDTADSVSRAPETMLSADQISQMMDEIQRLMSEGRMAEAEALLEQFNRMMENLQMWRGEGGEGSGQGEGGEAQRRLTESLREQQRLSDEAFRNRQDQQAGGSAEKGASTQELADRQRELREDLGRQRGLMPGRGTERGEDARRSLDDAGRAMEEAERALRRGDQLGAMERQADAIERMRGGLRALSQMGAPEGAAGQRGEQERGGASDPLGRALAEGTEQGTISGGEALDGVPTDPAARARELQDEIRRRQGQQSRPQDERDYLDRLLEGF